jgi:hypothetical protein
MRSCRGHGATLRVPPNDVMVRDVMLFCWGGCWTRSGQACRVTRTCLLATSWPNVTFLHDWEWLLVNHDHQVVCVRHHITDFYLLQSVRMPMGPTQPPDQSILGVIRSGRGFIPPPHTHSRSGAVHNYPSHYVGRTYNFGVLNLVVRKHWATLLLRSLLPNLSSMEKHLQ